MDVRDLNKPGLQSSPGWKVTAVTMTHILIDRSGTHLVRIVIFLFILLAVAG